MGMVRANCADSSLMRRFSGGELAREMAVRMCEIWGVGEVFIQSPARSWDLVCLIWMSLEEMKLFLEYCF